MHTILRLMLFVMLMAIVGLVGCASPQSQARSESSQESTAIAIKTVLLDKHVSVDIPAYWILTQMSADNNRLLYSIPMKETENTPYGANATIVAEYCDASLTVRQFGDAILGRMVDPSQGNVIVSDEPDGKYWRSVMWRGQAQVPYLIRDRFGVKNGVSVQLRIAFPLLDNSDQSQQILTDEINRVTQSLSIR